MPNRNAGGTGLAMPIPVMRRPTGLPVTDPVKAFLPPEYWDRKKDAFTYSLDFNPLTASITSTLTVQVQNDSDFLALAMSFTEATTVAGTTEQAYPPVLIRISDTASGAFWQDSPTHLQNVVQSMGINRHGPYYLPVPRLVSAGAAVTVECTNLEATNRRLWVSFLGCKIFRF